MLSATTRRLATPRISAAFSASGTTLGILAVVELVRSLSVKHQQFQTVLVEIEFLLGDVLQRAQLWTAIKTQRMAEVQRMDAF